eukprot:5535723-Pleurochrysis_carterae.AAC.1
MLHLSCADPRGAMEDQVAATNAGGLHESGAASNSSCTKRSPTAILLWFRAFETLRNRWGLQSAKC